MTDVERKGVEVTILVENVYDEINHGTGEDVEVVDGHLFVVDSTNSTLGVYAPGRWVRALLVKDQAAPGPLRLERAAGRGDRGNVGR